MTRAAGSSPLVLKNLSVSIGRRCVVNRVSLEIPRGKITALVGESGSGKSITAKTILGVMPNNATVSGEVLLDGQNVLDGTGGAVQKMRTEKIAIIFQDPVSSMDPLQKIGKKLAESLGQVSPEMDAGARRKHGAELLRQVRIDDTDVKLNAYPHQLSGGECQRIAIADALTKSPQFLIADEPTTALDVATQKQILALLVELSRTLDIGILLITHNLEIVKTHADIVHVMRAGGIVESGGTDTFFNSPRHPYTRLLLGGGAVVFPKKPAANDTLLEVRNLALDFAVPSLFGKNSVKPMLRDISFSLRSGECTGIIGESGSGKTTLGLAILKILPARGELVFQGESILEKSSAAFRKTRRHMQIVFQNPFSSFNPRILVGKSVSEGLAAYEKLSGREHDERVCAIFNEVGLSPEHRFKYPHELSGGELQRAAIARALLLRPDLIILDEPTSSLDHAIQFQIIRLLQSMQERYSLSYLFITHDLQLAKSLCSTIILLEQGRIVRQGPTATVMRDMFSESKEVK